MILIISLFSLRITCHSPLKPFSDSLSASDQMQTFQHYIIDSSGSSPHFTVTSLVEFCSSSSKFSPWILYLNNYGLPFEAQFRYHLFWQAFTNTLTLFLPTSEFLLSTPMAPYSNCCQRIYHVVLQLFSPVDQQLLKWKETGPFFLCLPVPDTKSVHIYGRT